MKKKQYNKFGERIFIDGLYGSEPENEREYKHALEHEHEHEPYLNEQQLRQTNEGDLYGIPARVIQINVPRAKLTVNPSFQSATKFMPFSDNTQIGLNVDTPVRHSNCGPEIPILLITERNQSYIMTAEYQNSHNQFQFGSYRKVSEIQLRFINGIPYTLQHFLNDVKKVKATDPVVKIVEQPQSEFVFGGGGVDPIVFNNQPMTDQKICINCPEDAKKRPKFPNFVHSYP